MSVQSVDLLREEPSRRWIQEKLADWIDTSVLVDQIVETCFEVLHTLPDLKFAQEVWYRTLEKLPSLLFDVVEHFSE